MHVQTDFESFSLDGRLLRSLREVNVLTPTTLQRAAFVPLMEGRDLALQAGPGTGRTFAWCLPVLHGLLASSGGGKVVIVAPSTEAAMDVESDVKRATRHARVSVLMPAAGVERSGASYEMFREESDLPDMLVGRAPSLLHFVEGTRFPLDRLVAFVVDATEPLDQAARDAITALIEKVPEKCQRVLVVSAFDGIAEAIAGRILRRPAIVTGTAAGTGPAAVEDAPGKVEPARVRVRKPTTQRRKPHSGPPESWPICHIGFTVTRNVTASDLARIVRVEARGLTVVLVGSEERGREVARRVEEVLRDRPVRFAGESDPLPEDEGPSVTVTLSAGRKRENLTANVLVLDRFPASADEYVSHIPMLRCEPADRIVSLVAPRDVGTQYQLRLATGIRLLERRLPAVEEMESMDQADVLRPLRDMVQSATQRDLDLLARVRTLDGADEILAVGLSRLLPAADASPEPARAPERRRPRRRDRVRDDRAPEKKEPAAEEPLIRTEGGQHLERGAGRRGGIPMVELELSCGGEDGVEASYLTQWLQSRLAMRVSELGPIRVLERRTYVTVPREHAAAAALVLGDLTFGGRKVEVRSPRSPGQDRS